MSGENYSVKVSVEKLTSPEDESTNWSTWEFCMRYLIKSKNLWDLIDPTEPKDEDAVKHTQVEKDKLVALILQSIHQDNVKLLTELKTPSEMWDTLKATHYTRRSVPYSTTSGR